MQHFKIRCFIFVFIFISIAVGCEKANDIAESAKVIAIKAQHLITTKAGEASHNAIKAANNAKQAAVKQIDKVGDQITTIVNETTQQVIVQIKAWIYKTLKPVFPWLFIISFLLFFVALKLAIPLSNFMQVQLVLAVVSYAVSLWIFTKMGLLAFAIKGSLWFICPFIISCLVVWFFRNTLKTKIVGTKNKMMPEVANQIG